MEKIYENYSDLHVRNVTVYGDSNHKLWANDDATFPISLEVGSVNDAFLKGMLTIDDGSIKRPISLSEAGVFATVAKDNDSVAIEEWSIGEATTPVSAATKGSYWGTTVSSMQSGISISGRTITGTLKWLASGQLVTDWGAGNFIALKFGVPEGATKVKVGLRPSVSSGLVELDSDKDAVIKVTDKVKQKLVVISTNGTDIVTETYDLSQLTCQTAQ